MIFIDTHLALAWGGGGREMAATQDDFALHEGWEGGAKPMQETLHEIKKKQSLEV